MYAVLDGAMAAPLPRPHRDDVRIALGGLLGGLVLWGVGLYSRTPDDPISLVDAGWAVLVPLVVMAGCELLRRTRPRTALIIGTLTLTADLLTRGSLATVVMFTDLVYAAVLYGSAGAARRIPWITGLITVIGTVWPVAAWQKPEGLLIGAFTGLVTFTPAATGWIVRNHRDTAAAERLRAERARMARELHDMVANHLSAIAIHSTAALSIDNPKTSRDALAVIRENSVDGLAEMRRLIGILRDGGGDREPAATPTLDGLATLVDGARANGLDVGLDADHGRVPAPVELAAYRIVQESLTNALKHAGPGRITVALAQREGVLDVRVTSPYGHRGAPRAPGSGAGLVGMRERAALLGGTFAAGRDGAVWAVRATLPLTEGAAA